MAHRNATESVGGDTQRGAKVKRSAGRSVSGNESGCAYLHLKLPLRWSAALGLASGLLVPTVALAQSAVVPDPSLGTTVGPDPVFGFNRVDGGAVQGQNLFHSFSTFNLGTGDNLYFIVPSADIASVFARVTGQSASAIDGILGTIQETAAGFNVSPATLFLINPYGIVFGENAQLDLGGSLVATTADGIRFGAAGSFSALTLEPPSPLLTVDPSALIFSQMIAGSIESQSSASAGFNYLGSPALGLRVADGRSLVLLGDHITVDGGGLNAFGGRVELGSWAGTGAVGLEFAAGNPKLVFGAGDPARGNIALANGSQISTIGPDQGDIVLYGQDVDLAAGSELATGIGLLAGTPTSRAGNIEVNATGRLRLTGSSDISTNVFLGDGSTGDIAIAAQRVEVLGGSAITAYSLGSGSSGNVTVRAADAIVMAGFSATGEGSQITSTIVNLLLEDAAGTQTGNVLLEAPRILLADAAQVIASSLSPAINAGNITILASDQLSLSGSSTLIQSITNADGDAGDIAVRAGTLRLESDALITTLTNASGNAGDISLEVGGDALLLQGGRLLAATYSQGDAGNILVRVNGTLRLEGTGGNDEASGIFSTADVGSTGRAGNVQVSGGALQLAGGGQINVATVGTGPGGNIAVNLSGLLRVDGGDITTLALLSSGGDIAISADQIRLSDGDISTVVLSGEGVGGDIAMAARAIIALNDSDILAFSVGGSGGNIRLDTPAFFAENFQPAPPGSDPISLDANGRSDVNATGAISSGAIALPDVSFIQNSLNELPAGLVNPDQLVAGSCIARSDEGNASLVVTGSDGLPSHPGESLPSTFATGPVAAGSAAPQAAGNAAPWQPGDAVVEATAALQLADGRLVLGQRCDR